MPRLSDRDATNLIESRVEPYYEHPERLYWEHRMWRNLAYLSGIQRFAQDPFGGLQPLLDSTGRRSGESFVANLILPAFERAVSKVCQHDPVFTVRPNGSSWRSARAAKLAAKVFRWVRDTTSFEAKRNLATAYAAATGLGVLKISYDPDLGEKERIYLAGPEELEDMGLPQGTEYALVDLPRAERERRDALGLFKDVATGGVRTDVVSPFGFYWDFDVRDGTLAEMDWASTVDVIETHKMEREYGLPSGSIPTDHGLDGGTLYEESAAVLHGGVAALTRWQAHGRGKAQRTRRIEYWERPNADNNHEGRKVVSAGGVILENGPNPYVKAGISLPFVDFWWQRRPGTYISNDLVGQLTGPNRAYNQHAQHAIDVERHNGWPMLVVPSSSEIKPHRLPNFAGPVLQVPMGAPPPFAIPPAPLPNYIGQNQIARRSEIGEIASQPDAVRGASPGQVRGSQGVQALQSAGNEVLGRTFMTQHESVARCGTMYLGLIEAFQSDEQIASVEGEDGKTDTFHFSGADLRGHTNIIIDAESRHVVDRTQREEILFDLARNKALDLTNPHDKRAVYRALQLRTGERFFDQQLANEDLAEEENAMLMELAEALAEAGPDAVPAIQSEFPEARDFHDHETHLDVHNQLRLTREYRQLPPHAQKLVDAHCQMHQNIISMIQQQMMQAQMAAEGGTAQPQPSQGASQ